MLVGEQSDKEMYIVEVDMKLKRKLKIKQYQIEQAKVYLSRPFDEFVKVNCGRSKVKRRRHVEKKTGTK